MSSILIRGFFLAAILATGAASVSAASEIIVAIRYLQATGTSHSHLYLYREDGKLLRQLTNDSSGQDTSPIFAPDGETIVFTREQVGHSEEIWSIDPRGQHLTKLPAAPEWYSSVKSSPFFTNIEEQQPTEATTPATEASPPDTTSLRGPTKTYKSPDGSVELVLREDPKDEDDQVDGESHGKHYLLRDLKTGGETEFGKLPGFFGVFGLLHERDSKDRYFLLEGRLRLAFFDLHLNSTDGDTCSALDLNTPRLVRLSPNWAAPIPLPGEAGFLTYTENRYVPIPGSTKTANCSYLEHWDEKLNKVRYARENTAAICYGMSMYRPGQAPLIITIRRHAD
jgi:WD40-like Beta Propeller Repeat